MWPFGWKGEIEKNANSFKRFPNAFGFFPIPFSSGRSHMWNSSSSRGSEGGHWCWSRQGYRRQMTGVHQIQRANEKDRNTILYNVTTWYLHQAAMRQRWDRKLLTNEEGFILLKDIIVPTNIGCLIDFIVADYLGHDYACLLWKKQQRVMGRMVYSQTPHLVSL